MMLRWKVTLVFGSKLEVVKEKSDEFYDTTELSKMKET